MLEGDISREVGNQCCKGEEMNSVRKLSVRNGREHNLDRLPVGDAGGESGKKDTSLVRQVSEIEKPLNVMNELEQRPTNIGAMSTEIEVGMETVGVPNLEIHHPLVNIPIQAATSHNVLSEIGNGSVSGQVTGRVTREGRKWKRMAGKKNSQEMTEALEGQSAVAGAKRPWRLQNESEETMTIEETSGCKKMKTMQEAVLLQVEEASLKWPQLYK